MYQQEKTSRPLAAGHVVHISIQHHWPICFMMRLICVDNLRGGFAWMIPLDNFIYDCRFSLMIFWDIVQLNSANARNSHPENRTPRHLKPAYSAVSAQS